MVGSTRPVKPDLLAVSNLAGGTEVSCASELVAPTPGQPALSVALAATISLS